MRRQRGWKLCAAHLSGCSLSPPPPAPYPQASAGSPYGRAPRHCPPPGHVRPGSWTCSCRVRRRPDHDQVVALLPKRAFEPDRLCELSNRWIAQEREVSAHHYRHLLLGEPQVLEQLHDRRLCFHADPRERDLVARQKLADVEGLARTFGADRKST